MPPYGPPGSLPQTPVSPGMYGAPAAHGGPPIARAEAVRGIGACIILTLVTCGFYGMYWQYMQFKTLNAWLGRSEHNYVAYLLLSIVTCGIYGLYYEYKFALSIQEVQRTRGMQVNEGLPVLAIVFALFGLAIVTWAIEQTEINRWYGE